MKNTNVITPNDSKEHVIDGYHFKVMSEFVAQEQQKKQEEKEDSQQNVESEADDENSQGEQVEEKIEQNAFQSSFVEDLLKKTDEMSSNIIKLQMQIESQESEFNSRLNTELESAKEKYTKEGYNQAKDEFEKELEELRDKYLKNIAKLDEACENLELFISKNEKELAHTAIDIAKEVINKELEENSAQIALNLAKDLIDELKGATDIELKVSPSDYDFIKSKLNETSHLKISLDDAISKGSVVVLSNTGNIESNLNNRLSKIKKMVGE